MLEVLTPAATNDLTVLATVKEELGIAPEDTTKDLRLLRLISEASSIVAQACKREGFGRALYRETFSSHHGTHWRRHGVILEQDLNPVIETVTVDGVEVDASGYALDSGILRRRILGNASTILIGSYGWNCHRLEITYWAGWELLAGVPPAVERVALDVVSALWSRRTAMLRDPSIRSEQIDGVGTITYGTQAAAAPLVDTARYPVLEQYIKQTLI